MHFTHQPSPSQSVLVHSSLCNPPTGNPPLQSVRVCPTSASATTVHCVFHLPQSELVLSISISVNENHLCSPHNRQPDRNQCLWIPWCAFHYVLPFCSFCLLAITPPPAGHHRVALSISAPVNKNHCAFHPSAITIAISAASACWQSLQSCLCVPSESTIQSVPHLFTVAFYFCTSEQESLCIPPISHHHRNQCLYVPVCAFHPPAIHRCNQCVCVQHPRQQPQFTVCSTCHNQNLCFLFLYQ